VTLRNRLCIGLSAIFVIADRGLCSLDLARCVSVVNVICEAVTRGVYKLRLDLAAHLTGVSDGSLVLATGVNGHALLPHVLTAVAAGRKPENAQKRKSNYEKREIDFAEFLHSSFLSEN